VLAEVACSYGRAFAPALPVCVCRAPNDLALSIGSSHGAGIRAALGWGFKDRTRLGMIFCVRCRCISHHYSAMIKRSPLAHRVPAIGMMPQRPFFPTLEYNAMDRILEILGGLAVCYIALSLVVYWMARS
jgi:hypothetical protein